jgi:hypothetical protein
LIDTLRILFIHEVDYLKKPIFEMHEFPEQLSLRGHQVAFLHFPEGDSPFRPSQAWKVSSRGRVFQDASLTLYRHLVLAPGILGRLITVVLGFLEITRVVREFRPEVMVSYSVPTTGWQAVLVAKLFKLPLVFRAIDVSHLIRRSSFSKLIKLAERFVYRESAMVSANNPTLLNYCQELAGRQINGIVNLPPIDLQRFAPRENRSASRNGKPRVIYMGSFFYFSGLERVIKDFCARSDLDFELRLVGGGEMEDSLKELVSNCDSRKDIVFPGFASFEVLPEVLQSSDIAINPMTVDTVSALAFPNKLIQYLAAGLTVVSTDLQGAKSLLDGHSKLFWCRDSDEIVETVAKLSLRNKRKPDSSRDLEIMKGFGYPDSIDSFEALLMRLAITSGK